MKIINFINGCEFMRLCNNCWTKQEDDSRFCENCGQRLEQESELAAENSADFERINQINEDTFTQVPPQGYYTPNGQQPTGNSIYQNQKPKKSMTRGTKILFIVVAACLVAAYFVLHTIFTPDKTADKFITAMRTKDFSMLSSVTEPSVKEMTLTKENVKPMFALYSYNNEFKTDVIKSLDEDAENIDRGHSPNRGNVVNLVEHDYILFKTYSVMISDCGVKLNSNLDNTTFTIGTKSATIDDSDKSAAIENLLPGTYTIKSTCNSQSGLEFNDETEYDIYDGVNENISTEFTCSTLIIDTDETPKITSITVNDKPVTFKADEDGLIHIQGMKMNSVAVVNHDTAWGTTQSDSYTMTMEMDGSADYAEFFYPSFAVDEQTQTDIANAAANFIDELYQAYNDRDTEKLRSMPECYTTKNFIENLEDFKRQDIEMPDYRYYVNYGVKEIISSKDVVYLDDNTYQTAIHIAFDYIGTHYHGSKATQNSGRVSSDYTITMTYKSGNWVCSGLDFKEYSSDIYNNSIDISK